MADLDLTEFFKEGSLANLDWLSVDEEEYRKLDNLPLQNLDVLPDLETLWSHDESGTVPHIIPNTGTVPTPGITDPRTMGDMSEVHGVLRSNDSGIMKLPGAIVKVARLSLMQSTDLSQLRAALTSRFDMDTLRQYRDVIASVLAERGLLGKLYIDSKDFAGCATGQANEFVTRNAASAKYILRKEACGDCTHCKSTTAGTPVCGQFKKELTVDIPYTDNLASKIETEQKNLGKEVLASTAAPRERIKLAYLATEAQPLSEGYTGPGVLQVQPNTLSTKEASEQLIQASDLVRKSKRASQIALNAKPVIDYLHREMLKGLTKSEITSGLKMAFTEKTLRDTVSHWGPLYKEAGLYGVYYIKQSSFSDCQGIANFIAKRNPNIRAVVADTACPNCTLNKKACKAHNKPIVKAASALFTFKTVEDVLLEHKMSGRLSSKVATTWGKTPEIALRAIHEAVRNHRTLVEASNRLSTQTAFTGNSYGYQTSGLVKTEIVKRASRLLTEGLYGQDLLNVLKGQFDVRDLVAAKSELKTLVSDAKYSDKLAKQREIMAAEHVAVDPATLVNNGSSMLAEFDMQHPIQVEVDEMPKLAEEIIVDLGSVGQKL